MSVSAYAERERERDRDLFVCCKKEDMDGVGNGIQRESSIEKEPRTLNINQIDSAREAALYVVNTSSVEEALRIFTQGLEPVVRCAGRQMDGGDEADHDEDDYDGQSARFPAGLRDIVSAPF